MLHANKLLFIILCLRLDETLPTITPEDNFDKTLSTKTPENNLNETLQAIPPEDLITDSLSIFQHIDKLVSCDQIMDELLIFKIKGVNGIEREHRLYMYNTDAFRICEDTESKSITFYICINCVFAEWVQNQLIEFVERIPYMYKIISTAEYGNDFHKHIDESKKHIEDIMEKINNFIHILFNFITKHSYNTVYSLVDTSLLRNLVSTNILFNYILRYPQMSDVKITVNSILYIVNEAQKFSAYNCDVRSSYYDNKYFFGYSMTKSKTDTNYIDIDEFLMDLMQFGLLTKHKLCNARQMLLGSVLTSVDDIVSKELKKVQLWVEGSEIKIDEDFYYAIEKSNNLDVIYWYMNIVLNAIIRLFCQKTIYVLDNDPVLNKEITEGFQILNFLFTELSIDSEELINGFNLLASDKEITYKESTELIKVMNEWYTRINKPEDINSESDVTTMLPFFHITIKKIQYEKPSLLLEPFMNGIINRVSDYKCFVNIFELLKIEREQKFLPHSRNPNEVFHYVYNNIILQPYKKWSGKFILKKETNDVKKEQSKIIEFREHNTNENMCEFVFTLYNYCAESYIIFTHDRKFGTINTKYGKEEISDVIYYIYDVLNYTHEQKIIQDRFLIELLFNILPVLKIKITVTKNLVGENVFVLIRILYMIMIELNKYALKSCTSDKYENLLFNNIIYGSMEEHSNEKHVITKELRKFINSNKRTFPVRIDVPDLFYPSACLKNFYDLNLFKHEVQLYWRGEQKTLRQIYESVNLNIFNPYYVYTLFDVNLKFLMTTMYYKLRIIMDTFQYNITKIGNIDHNIYLYMLSKLYLSFNDLHDFTYIPLEFRINMEKCVKEIYNSWTQSYVVYRPYNPNECITVENILKKSGIVINSKLRDREPRDNVVQILQPDSIIQETTQAINKYNTYNIEIKSVLIKIKDEFLKLMKFYYSININ